MTEKAFSCSKKMNPGSILLHSFCTIHLFQHVLKVRSVKCLSSFKYFQVLFFTNDFIIQKFLQLLFIRETQVYYFQREKGFSISAKDGEH